MAQEGRGLLVPLSLIDASDFDMPPCRPLKLLFLLPGSATSIAAVQHVMLRHPPQAVGPRWYFISANHVSKLLRLSSNRDSSGRLHMRVTARCDSYTMLSYPHHVLLDSTGRQLSLPCSTRRQGGQRVRHVSGYRSILPQACAWHHRIFRDSRAVPAAPSITGTWSCSTLRKRGCSWPTVIQLRRQTPWRLG